LKFNFIANELRDKMKFTPIQVLMILGETHDPWTDTLSTGALTGLQLKACSVALEQYSKRCPAAQLDHIKVIVKDELDGLRVSFLPEPDDYQEYGGASKFGETLDYVVSKDKFEVIRIIFNR
jgi:hypothetical protein